MAFRRHRSHSTLRHRVVELIDAADIVQCSFFLHNSITHLDLNLCEYASFRGKSCYTRNSNPCLSWWRYIHTEESCRRIFIPERKCLYTFHLDVPQGREFNIRNVATPRDFDYTSGSIHVIVRIKDKFFSSVFFSHLEYAFENTQDKLKVIRWLLDFAPPELTNLPMQILHYFLTELHLECTDSDFVNRCIKKFNLIGSLCRQEQPKLLEYLLYHVNKSAYSTEKCPSSRPSFVDMCISNSYLLNVGPYLKYRSEACFTANAYAHFKREMYRRKRILTRGICERPEGWMSQERNHRLLQIIMLFYQNYPNPLVPPEVLRLIWSSIPDAYILLEEMREAYREVLSDTEIEEIYSLYTAAIGETPQCNQPRTLLHYSRIAVRRSLHQNKQWLPDGIRQLLVPECLESFLNLDMPLYGCVHLMDTDDSE